MWDSGVIGDTDPYDAIFFTFFCLRKVDKHMQLSLKNPNCKKNLGLETQTIVYTERTSKTNQDGNTTKVVSVERNKQNSERCFVRLFDLYLSKLPKECFSKGHFYFYPKLNWKFTDKIWFTDKHIFKCLKTRMKEICQNAEITGYKTNHSLRATAITNLYIQKVPECEIARLSGHSSISELRRYYRPQREFCANKVMLVIFGCVRTNLIRFF